MKTPQMLLNTDQQIEKLNEVSRIADEAFQADAIDRQLGAFLLYAGLVEFILIQAARLLDWKPNTLIRRSANSLQASYSNVP